jgi:hypothetical protein
MIFFLSKLNKHLVVVLRRRGAGVNNNYCDSTLTDDEEEDPSSSASTTNVLSVYAADHNGASSPTKKKKRNNKAPTTPSSTTTTTTPTTTPSKKNTPRRVVVTFNAVMSLRLTLHINDYYNDEIDACWYRRDEYQKMRSQVLRFDAARNQLVPLSDDDEGMLMPPEQDSTELYCSQGLERYTRTGCSQQQERFHSILAVQKAVLLEGERKKRLHHHQECNEDASSTSSSSSSGTLFSARTKKIKGLLYERRNKNASHSRTPAPPTTRPSTLYAQKSKATRDRLFNDL